MTASATMSATRDPIRVIVVDDHPVVRRGLSALLEDEPDIECCGEAEDLLQAAETFESTRPDVVLVDLNLGDADGLDLLRYLNDWWVGARAVVVSQHPPEYRAAQARAAGAKGYVCKDEMAQKIVRAVRAVYDGQTFFDD